MKQNKQYIFLLLGISLIIGLFLFKYNLDKEPKTLGKLSKAKYRIEEYNKYNDNKKKIGKIYYLYDAKNKKVLASFIDYYYIDSEHNKIYIIYREKYESSYNLYMVLDYINNDYIIKENISSFKNDEQKIFNKLEMFIKTK